MAKANKQTKLDSTVRPRPSLRLRPSARHSIASDSRWLHFLASDLLRALPPPSAFSLAPIPSPCVAPLTLLQLDGEVKRVFAALDKDSSGSIDMKELRKGALPRPVDLPQCLRCVGQV